MVDGIIFYFHLNSTGGISMGKYEEQLAGHEINKTLMNIEKQLDKIDADNEKYVSAETIDDYERLRRVYIHVKNELERVDPLLINIGTVNNLQVYLQNIYINLQNFHSSINIAELNQANIHADNLLREIAFISYIQEKRDIDGLKESITSFKRSAGQYISSLDKKSKQVKLQLTSLKTEIEKTEKTVESQKTRLDTFISQNLEQMNVAESRRNEQITIGEQKRVNDVTVLIEDSKQEVDDEIEKLQNKFKELEKSLVKTQSDIEESLEAEVELIVEKINIYRKQAEELVRIISNTGMVGGYQAYANDERVAAEKWQKIALGAFLGMIAFIVWVFFISNGSEMQFTTLIMRVLVVSAFLILATYSAKLANRHEKMERRYRRMELELASVNPYLAGLQEEERNALIQKFAIKYFGNIDVEDKSDDVGVASPVDWAKRLVESATNKKE